MKKKYQNRIRIWFQVLIIGFILYEALRPVFDTAYAVDFEAYCPFGGIATFMSWFNLNSLSCQMGEVQIMLGLGLIAATLFIGKLFCSYICPIGSISEWLGKIGDKLKIRRDMPEFLDRPFRVLKYALLYITIYYTMTSSELFCKEFDPYFASVNLLDNTDIVLYFAIPALVITILGAIFFRVPFCKYLCPLSAASNIFYNAAAAIIVIAAFIAANLLGAGLSLVWLLSALVLIGVISEVGFKRSFGLPAAKVTRISETCTDCGICEDKCPQGIKIMEYKNVNHIDCNLCTDCVYSCPVKQSLTINKKPIGKYLSPVTVIVIIAISLFAASFYEFATLTEKWGDYENVENMQVYEQTGLKSVKCFGSATSFKNQISHIKGIYGLDAYATSHTVKIYFNPDEITHTGVRKSIFKPAKQRVRLVKKAGIDSLSVYNVSIEHLFDNYDYANLSYALQKNKGIFGFTTMFGEPVNANIYFCDTLTTTDEIENSILVKEVELKLRTGGTTVREMDFDLAGEGKILQKISINDYNEIMFKKYDRSFNHYKKYDKDSLKVLIYPMKEAAIASLYPRLSYLMSHLSTEKGIVRFATRYTDKPTAFVFFDEQKSSLKAVKEKISAPMLEVHFRDGSIKEVENPFKSKPDGEVKIASEINDIVEK